MGKLQKCRQGTDIRVASLRKLIFVVPQEYYLGKWNKDLTADLRKKLEVNKNEKLKYKKIDGLNLPYFEVEMVDGTLCDLNNEARITRVLYVCYAHGKNEIYSLKETSSCNYEIVVLTPNLCLHPKYKIQETKDNAINCVPLDNAPKKPKSLLAMEVESMKLRYQKLMVIPRFELSASFFPFFFLSSFLQPRFSFVDVLVFKFFNWPDL